MTARAYPAPQPLAELVRAMDAKATKGPWFVVGPPWNRGAPFINALTEDPHGGHVVCDFAIQDENDDGMDVREPHMTEDARLTCTLRNALPLLADLLAAGEALREQAQRLVDEGCDDVEVVLALVNVDAASAAFRACVEGR